MQMLRVIIWKLLPLLLLLLVSIKAQRGSRYSDFDDWDSDEVHDWLEEKEISAEIIDAIDDLDWTGGDLLDNARNGFEELMLDTDAEDELLNVLCQYVDNELCDTQRNGGSHKKSSKRIGEKGRKQTKTNKRGGKKGNTTGNKKKRQSPSTKKHQPSGSGDGYYTGQKSEEVLSAMMKDLRDQIQKLEIKIKEESPYSEPYSSSGDGYYRGEKSEAQVLSERMKDLRDQIQELATKIKAGESKSNTQNNKAQIKRLYNELVQLRTEKGSLLNNGIDSGSVGNYVENDGGNSESNDASNKLDPETIDKIIQMLNQYQKSRISPPSPPTESKADRDKALTDCFHIVLKEKKDDTSYADCTAQLQEWIDELIPTDEPDPVATSEAIAEMPSTSTILSSTDIGKSSISSGISSESLQPGSLGIESESQENPKNPEGYPELLVSSQGSTKNVNNILVEKITFSVRGNPADDKTKWYQVNWWRKDKETKIMQQLFDKNRKESLEFTILPEIDYTAEVEALDKDEEVVARSLPYFFRGSALSDNMEEVCISTRLKVRGYAENQDIGSKDLDMYLMQHVEPSSGWNVDPNERMTVTGPLTYQWSTLRDKNIAEDIRYMMLDKYKIPRIEVSQICLVAFEGESQSYVSGTQLLVGGSLLVMVIGLFLLRQRLKTDEGAAMLSSLKNTMGKFGGVLAANTRLGGNSMNNNSHANEIGKNYNPMTHGGGIGKRGHAHGSDSEDEELRITNGANETDTIMDTGEDDIDNENRMSHSNNNVKTGLNLTKRGNYDEKKTRKTDFISTSSQPSESNERTTKEMAKHSNKNTELPKRQSKSSTDNIEKSNNGGGSRKNIKDKAQKQPKQTKRKEKQPSDDDSVGNRSLEEEQEEEEEEEEETRENTTGKRNKNDTSSANKNDESSVDFEDF